MLHSDLEELSPLLLGIVFPDKLRLEPLNVCIRLEMRLKEKLYVIIQRAQTRMVEGNFPIRMTSCTPQPRFKVGGRDTYEVFSSNSDLRSCSGVLVSG